MKERSIFFCGFSSFTLCVKKIVSQRLLTNNFLIIIKAFNHNAVILVKDIKSIIKLIALPGGPYRQILKDFLFILIILPIIAFSAIGSSRDAKKSPFVQHKLAIIL